jgi:hypothetical protein
MPATDPSFAVRVMRPEDIEIIRTWATAEGWNPGVHDSPCFYATDPQGFFVGELDGKAVSCISCVAYDSVFGFLGQYIVQPAVRGRGYGVKTWAAGMNHLGGRNVGLDGVLAQQSNYERSGFRYAHQHVRFEGTGGGVRPDGVVGLSTVPFDVIVAYDRACFPAARPEFLRRWIALPDAHAFAVVAQGVLRGYGVIRRSVDGHKVGPLFADDAATADQLLRALWATAPGSRICIDIPDDTANPAAGRLVQSLGTRELFRTARMYTAGAPVVDGTRVFGITTMELG